MAVMLTQWSPVPWSGETVPRPVLPPPAGASAPTPIYETLVREWSLAGRTVPGQGGRHGRTEPVETGGRWWRTEEAQPSYGGPSPVAPGPAAYGGGVYGGNGGDLHGGNGGDVYGTSVERYSSSAERHATGTKGYGTSAAPYRSIAPYVGVSGYGDGGDDAGGRAAEARPAEGAAGETEAAAADRAEAEERPPAWERVAIL
ncbi:hypothetical protein E4198_13865 [Streptomyces sp. RKND-216]|uniref:hypothetical protein n=1 Tax=Streptomyces sp. RKND-216 TaxID=2562581 RepID=UPI00109DC7F5|nr:hypothetical protein [Streptomyces sp. RKND-216]THA25648.1 hypothetical protein E4198_13865 [Streptomyces sp. RKND-216]